MASSSWCCERSFRFAVRVGLEGRTLTDYPVCLRVDFERLLAESGGKGVFDRDSVAVVRVDPTTGEPLVSDESYSDERQYCVPHRLFWDHQNQDPEEKIAWILEDSSEDAAYAVYFDTVGENHQSVDYGTRAIGAGDPLMCADVVLNVGFWSTPAAVNWGPGGKLDLVVGTVSNRSMLRYYENVGTRGAPLFKDGVRLKSGLSYIRGTQPSAVDWNGDGVDDLLVMAADSGRWDSKVLVFYEKVGEGRTPLLEERNRIELEVNEFGGVVSFTAADWDADGLWDLVVARANREGECRFFFHKNMGDRENPSFAEPEIISIDGGEMMSERNRTGMVSIAVSDWFGDGRAIRSSWRIKPTIWPVNGRRDLIVSDLDGYAVRYRDTGRTDRPVFEYAGRLILENGQEFRPFSAGGNNPLGGRTRYVAVDWNGDGLLDLLMTNNEGTTGSGILYYENSGTNEDPVFFRRHYLMVNGREIRAGSGHAANHCAIDWFETGLADLMVGNDDGFLHLYRNSFFEDPPEIEVADLVERTTGSAIDGGETG